MARLPRMSKKEKLTLLADIEYGNRPFDKHALTILRSLLDDPDSEVRAEAIACLWNDPDPKWIDILMTKASEDAHEDVRAHAISALGVYIFEGEAASFEDWDGHNIKITESDYARVSDFLFRIAQDPEEDFETRRYAIEALAFRSDDPDVADLINWAYNHRDRRLKVSAIFAMARHGDPRWTDYILEELHSPYPEIQFEAVRASADLALQEATDTLIEIVQNRTAQKQLRLIAIYALGQTGDERAYTVLDRLAHSRDKDVRKEAREAIEDWLAISTMEEMADETLLGFEDDDPFVTTAHFEHMPDIWADTIGTFSRN